MVRKIFISLLVFVILLSFFSKALAQDSCKDTLSIADLKERLHKIQKIRDDAERGIKESDKILMKAQEIILLARAKGDVKAGQVAEEAARSAEKSKEEHRKNKEEAEKQIAILKEYIDIAQQNNLKCMTDVCNKYREQINRDKEAFKRLIKESEELAKRQNERLEEIRGEIKDFVLDILPIAGELFVGGHKLYGKLEKFRRLKETNPEKYKQILITLDNLSNNYKETKKYVDLLDKGTKSIKAFDLSYETTSQYLLYLEKIRDNNEAAQKELENLRQLYSEATEFALDVTHDEILDQMHKVRGILAKSATAISILKSVLDVVYHYIKIDFLDEEVNGDYKLSDNQLRVFNALKAQFDKDWHKLKECENYSKKLR